jgi:hypothetical protein
VYLSPPGNIRKSISNIQHSLFQERGFVSALSLPPMVPLMFTRDLPDEPARQRIEQRDIIETSNIIWKENVCYLEISPPELWSRIRKPYKVLETAGLFDLHHGLFLAHADTPSDIAINDRFAWAVTYLECIKLELIGDRPYWWQGLYWETVWKKRLRRVDPDS